MISNLAQPVKDTVLRFAGGQEEAPSCSRYTGAWSPAFGQSWHSALEGLRKVQAVGIDDTDDDAVGGESRLMRSTAALTCCASLAVATEVPTQTLHQAWRVE